MDDAGGPTRQLLKHTEKILILKEAIRARKLQLRTLYGTGFATLLAVLAIYISTVLTWRTVDLARVNKVAIPLTVICGIAFVILYFNEQDREESEDSMEGRSVKRLELDLELAEEERLLEASTLGLPKFQRQYSYKDSLPRELEGLREEAQHYRRIHNVFQSIIIIGSLGTTTAASLADTPSYLKWVTVGLSFAVGLSAGFTGYFKYRERSFYLQQTADAIEQHATAYQLGISPYTDEEEEVNLAKFAEQVELLRVEQRKRQQQLDQPHEGRDGTV